MRSISSLIVLGLAVPALLVEAAIFPKNGPVKALEGKTWKKTLSDGYPAIVAFTAPWCGHCQKLAPEFSKAAESLSPLISFYNVDCDEAGNQQFCSSEGVKGYPTIKAYTKGSKTPARDYNNARAAKDLIEYASSLIPVDKVKKLKASEEITDWLHAKSDQPHALLLHPSNPSVPLMWKTLASRLHSSIHFGFLRDEKGEAKKVIGIENYGKGEGKKDGVRVVVWKDGGEGQAEVYEAGPLKFEPLFNYFKSLAGEPVEISSSASRSSSYTTSTTPPSTPSPTPSVDRSAKRKEQEAKWAEEERRDQLRREKREQDRLARLLADQERVTDEQDALEDSGPQGTPVEAAADPVIPAQPAEASADGLSAETTVPEPQVPQEPGEDLDLELQIAKQLHGVDQSADTPLKAASEEFETGMSGGDDVFVDNLDRSGDQSATTPLEQVAEEFEHGQHKAVRDESPTEERIRDEL